eukprot:9445624-Prorocentrum_lima.AAC.1
MAEPGMQATRSSICGESRIGFAICLQVCPTQRRVAQVTRETQAEGDWKSCTANSTGHMDSNLQ